MMPGRDFNANKSIRVKNCEPGRFVIIDMHRYRIRVRGNDLCSIHNRYFVFYTNGTYSKEKLFSLWTNFSNRKEEMGEYRYQNFVSLLSDRFFEKLNGTREEFLEWLSDCYTAYDWYFTSAVYVPSKCDPNPENVRKTLYWKKMESALLKDAKPYFKKLRGGKPKKLKPIPFGNWMLFEDRYLPIFFTTSSPSQSILSMYTIDPDGKLIPLKSKLLQTRASYAAFKKALGHQVYILFNDNYMSGFDGSSASFNVVFFDKNESKLVLSESLLEQFKDTVRGQELPSVKYLSMVSNSLNTTRVDDSDQLPRYFEMMSGSNFVDRFNTYLRDKGIESLTVTKAVQAMHCGFATITHFENGYRGNHYRDHAGYFVSISFNGEQIIGPEKSFKLFVEDRGESGIYLVNSSWCQHTTNWSQTSAYTALDQSYYNWEITDWICGPFAQRAKIEVPERPFIFNGLKLNPDEKRRKLAQFRENMRSAHNDILNMARQN
jgi:hypothetical protein